ncbi:hypothetical protein BGX34_008062 [Mortierella sp. NVP85]|nr:hypothetical protein BGX34_008062 [Mortierella sp. NVP85]
MGFALLFFGLAVAFFVALVHALEAIPDSGKNGICTSRECTIVAADILRDMKPGVDPCTNFFDFACGGFVDRVPIPDDKPKIGYFDVVQKQNQEIIKAILTPETTNVQKEKDDAKKRNLLKLQSMYESCTDEKKISEVGVKPLLDLVQNMVKTFPADTSVLSTDLSPSTLEKNLKVLQDINERMISHGGNIPMAQHWQNQGLDEDLPRHVKARADAVDALSATFTGSEKDLALAISQLTLVDLSSMVDFNVDADPKNPDVNVLFLDESGLGLPSKQYYDDEKIVATYQKVVGDMFTIVMGKGKDVDKNGARSTKPDVWAEVAKNIVEFEKRLAKISSDPEDLRNSEITYNPRSLSQISELIPTIDWPLLIEKLVGKGTKVPNPIIVSMPEYLQKLNTLLKDTPAVTLQNYFAWRLIRKLSANLEVELQKPMQQLKAVLEGVSEDLVTPRWETCVNVVNDALGPMAGYYFIEKTFKGDSKDMADGIITSLRTSFTKGLSHLTWLDKETRSNATEKVELLTQKIGYSTTSPDVRSPESLEEYFKNLVADKGDFFGNQLRARTWRARKVLGDLDKPVDKARWMMDPQTVNAYYNAAANEVVFPAGILQQPYFHVDNPEYLNFGSIGSVAGHELTHAFDNEGRLYDARGKLVDWWTNSTLQHFQEKSQCFIDQYGNFTVKDPQGRENHVNGKLTLGENLADNGGLKNAFDAWEERFKSDSRGNKYDTLSLLMRACSHV